MGPDGRVEDTYWVIRTESEAETVYLIQVKWVGV